MKKKHEYYRRNKMGHTEKVTKYDGSPEIGVLNEIISTVIDLVNNSSNKDIEDPICQGSTNIAESSMSENILVEWLPEFKGGDYDPGEAAMDSPKGGIPHSKKSMKSDQDTTISKVGAEFPGKHKETVAMCDVDEDGVEGEPQGSHESTHGEPDDGFQTKVGHDWPAQPKLAGGMFEKVPGSRYGGGMGGGVDEHIAEVGNYLAENSPLQILFNDYANTTDFVTLEEFQSVCDECGYNHTIDEATFVGLLESDAHHVFSEEVDGWMATKAPNVTKNLHGFFESVATLLKGKKTTVSEAVLNKLWNKHASGISESMLTDKAKTGISTLQKKYPGFKPFSESSAKVLDSGKFFGGGAKDHVGQMPDSPGPDDIKTLAGENLLTRQPTNKIDTPTLKGSKGSIGENLDPVLKRNAQALYQHVTKKLAEAKNSIRGDYKVSYTVVVKENAQVNKTTARDEISEAILDAEEVLQHQDAENVSLEANFSSPAGQTLFMQQIPLFTIHSHQPVTSEGKTLFRFRRHAENFASKVVGEGRVCRVVGHNWGAAVLG